MDPLVCSHDLGVEVCQVLDYCLEEVSSVVFEGFAEFYDIAKINLMYFQLAEFVRVVVFEGGEEWFFLSGFREEADEALECPLVRVRAKKCLDEHIVYDLTRLRTGRFVDPKYFQQLVLVVDERGLKPVNAMEKKGEMFWRVERLLYEVGKSLG